MQVKPLRSKGVAATTMELCMESCKAKKKCQFYLFEKKATSCKLYSKPKMKCAGYLGAPRTAMLECSDNDDGIYFRNT